MALLKDSLWGIVNGTETPPQQVDAEKYAKFVIRKDRTLALVVLTLEPSLLYLIGQKIQLLYRRNCQSSFRTRLGPINWNFNTNSMYSVSRREGLCKDISLL